MPSYASPPIITPQTGMHWKLASWRAVLSHLYYICQVYAANLTTDTDIASDEDTRCGGVLPAMSAFMDDVTTQVQSCVMGKVEGQAQEKPKHFQCPWDHLRDLFLH